MGALITIRRASRDAGFTLIELLTTVTIVGVLAMLGVPAMQKMILAQHVRTAASELQTTLYYARSEAIKRATNVDVVPCSAKYPPTCGSGSPDWKNGWVVQISGVTPTVLKTQAALSDQLSSMAGSAITYRSDGHVTSTPGTIVITTTNSNVQARCLKIDLSGRPNVNNYTYGGSNSCS
ncbi:MAG TPA: GspH/FimT family pseudopilin [Casimicrobiaceae bacterium]|nr:GspH/FimT family pseudopilin [Casimicrobiaceae bacterium]